MKKFGGTEERVYRHRCVEAWSMVIPWDGFPLAKLVDFADPKPEAKYIQFTRSWTQGCLGAARWELWMALSRGAPAR